MFAYCLNNPVNGCDPCGTCFHRWDFWNDCEKCGGKTLGNKVDDAIEWCVDKGNTINYVYQQQAEAQMQLTMLQNELITDAAGILWDAHMHSIEMEMQAQYGQDIAIIKASVYLADNPPVAIDVATGAVGTALSYVGYATAAAGVTIPVVGQVAIGVVGVACGIWGMYRLAVSIYEFVD